MNLAQAFQEKLIDRFEMMSLAEQLYSINQQSQYILSPDNIEFQDGHFVFHDTVRVKKKEILLNLSALLSSVFAVTDRRLTSIFMNHYLSYLNNVQAYKYLPKSKRKPFIVACGGLSGSGKSRVSREIAPFLTQPFGAIIIRDDIVRKQLVGVPFDVQLDDRFFTPENEARVYREMRRQAKYALMAGYPVVLDALFWNPEERKKIEHFAHQINVPFEGFWMRASLQARAERVQSRQHNPSDVKNQNALEKQLSYNTGVIFWRLIDTDGAKEQTLAGVRKQLKKYL